MTFKQALHLVQQGQKCRRPCWQPGWIEMGTHQGELSIFYVNPTDVEMSGHTMPEMRLTWTPIKVVRTDPRTGLQYLYPEDQAANDWVQVA